MLPKEAVRPGSPIRGQDEPQKDSLLLRVVIPTWVIAVIVLSAVMQQRIAEIRFPDPDDMLRLVQVRDWIGGQGWFDLVQHRMNVPDGAPMHWSRLVDVPIAGMILLLRPFLGNEAAEWWAAYIVPLLSLLVLMAVLARHTDRLFGRQAALFACILTITTPPIIRQFQPYRIDHHGWQMVCVALMMAGLLDRQPRRGGWIAGVAMAGWLAISLEALPLVAASLTILGLAWICRRNEADGVRLEACAIALAAFSAALWIATRAPEGFTVFCDSLSLIHVAAFAVAAVCVSITHRTAHQRISRFAGLGLGAILAAGVLAVAAPQCVTGAFNDLPPLVYDHWYRKVAEGLPIWDQTYREVLNMLVFLPVTLGGIVALSRLQPDGEIDWQIITGMVVASVLISFVVARASGAAAVVALPIVAATISRLFDYARGMRTPVRRIIATTASLVLVMPSIVFGGLIPADQGKSKPQGETPGGIDSCLSRKQMALLNETIRSLDDGLNVLAPLDISPSVLLHTDLTVVASGHHRNKVAINDVIRFWIGQPDKAHAIAKARKIDYVLYCPGLPEVGTYSNLKPDGMMSQLVAGKPPAWLIKLEDPNFGTLHLYQVVY